MIAVVAGLLLVFAPAQADATEIRDPAYAEFLWQRKHGAPTLDWWDKVARCETAENWADKGSFSGGLGIYTAKSYPKRGMGTWERWGGEDFAPRPAGATRIQQVVVANRIAMFGWRYGPHLTDYKWAVGFGGWGCLRASESLSVPRKAILAYQTARNTQYRQEQALKGGK